MYFYRESQLQFFGVMIFLMRNTEKKVNIDIKNPESVIKTFHLRDLF